MVIIKDDIWSKRTPNTPICITTNGFVTKAGECVMGRGIALQAKRKYHTLPTYLGKYIKQYGNRVFYFNNIHLISFPVKHNWYEKADIELIKQSANQLLELKAKYKFDTIYITKPGCHNGKLDWETEVKPILEPLFTDDTGIIICDIN